MIPTQSSKNGTALAMSQAVNRSALVISIHQSLPAKQDELAVEGDTCRWAARQMTCAAGTRAQPGVDRQSAGPSNQYMSGLRWEGDGRGGEGGVACLQLDLAGDEHVHK